MQNNIAILTVNEITAEYEDLIEDAKRLYDQQIAKGTRRVYLSDWKIFIKWCQSRSWDAENATPKIVALFITAQFLASFHPTTINRRLASIKFMFANRGLVSPTDSPIVRAIMKGIRRDEKASPSQPKKAAVVEIVKAMVDLCPTDTLRGIRDRAIILVGFAGGYRRSEITAICVEDIEWQAKGMDIKIHRSKTDQEGKGDVKAILKARDPVYCPILAVKKWLETTNITEGHVFRGITKNNTLKKSRLSDDIIYKIIKKYSVLLGYDFAEFSPHSLRSGFTTSAIERNAKLTKVMSVTKHKTMKSLQGYILHAERYKDHPAEDLL